MAATAFAEMPESPEPVVALVIDHLERECAARRCPPTTDIDRLAEIEVRELWDRPVKVFVPILAFRSAREPLYAEFASSAIVPERAERGQQSMPAPARQTQWFADDTLETDDRDVVRLD